MVSKRYFLGRLMFAGILFSAMVVAGPAFSIETIQQPPIVAAPIIDYPIIDFLNPIVLPIDLGPGVVSPAPPGEPLYPPAPILDIPYTFDPWLPLVPGPIGGIIDIGEILEFTGPFDLLVIADEDFIDALQPLKAHKDYTDVRTRIYSWQTLEDRFHDQGRDVPERLKKAIASFRQSSGIRYVMLVGDSDRFPVRHCRIYDPNHWGHGYAPADLYYADLYKDGGTSFDDWDGDGDGVFCEMQAGTWTPGSTLSAINLDDMDLYPDVAVGRVPASTEAEVTTYVNKVIDYEFASYKASWFDKGLLIVPGYEDDGKYWDYPGSWAAKEDVDDHLSAVGVTSTKLYDHRIEGLTPGLGDGDPGSAAVTGAINGGLGFVNFSGHGGPGVWSGALGAGDMGSLSNEGELPIVFAAACSTARFHFETTWLDTAGNVFVQTCPGGQCWPKNPGAQLRPEPAAVQRTAGGTSYDLDSLAEDFLVKRDAGAVGYIGGYTGTQGGSQYLDRYLFEGYRYSMKPPALGYLWNYAIRRYIDNDFHIYFNDTCDWCPQAMFHHIQKYMLFGDPSLRVGGVSRFQRADFAKTYAMFHDGWQGELTLSTRNGDFIESMPNMGGIYTGSDDAEHEVRGYVRTATYPIPESWGPDHKVLFYVDFADTPSQEDDQRFEGYLFSWDRNTMAGVTWWNDTPYGFYAGGEGVFVDGPQYSPGAISMNHFVGTYAMNHDGWEGTLELWEATGIREIGSANVLGMYTGGDGTSHLVRGFVRTTSQSMPAEWGPDHKIEFYIDFPDTGSQADDQKFEGYLFTQTKDAMAGVTWWNTTPYGFYAQKQRGPVPGILANALKSLSVGLGQEVSVTVQADPGILMEGQYDWWLAASTPFGWFSYQLPGGFQPGIQAAFQAPLSAIPEPLEILRGALPQGSYTFYFGFDDQPNGEFDGDYWLDWVVIQVE